MCSFSGLCLERPGCDCTPKKVRHVPVEVIIGTNSSSTNFLCTTVDIEEHRGECRCKCNLLACHFNKLLDEDACACRCKPEFAALKASCASDFERSWHEDTCTCKCKPRICVSGHYQDRNTCGCRPVEAACAPATAVKAADPRVVIPTAAAQAPKYIGLACVAVIALAREN